MRSHVVPIVALALIALPLYAQSNDVAVWFGSSTVGTTNTSGSSVHFDRGDSIGASWNHFFSGQLSTELAAFAVRHDGAVRVGDVNAFDVGRLRMIPITAMIQWHLVHFRHVDPHLGAGLAYVRSDSLHSSDLDNAGIGRVRIKSRVGWTTDAGLTYGVTQRIGIGVDARYIGYRPSSGPADASLKLHLSPVIYSLGLRWRL
ncbi:MAG TPA: OmpW family outer membrane protein [Thermoanaerobaculia bacterium]|nr:OmpW family outer membrane protein [Thermoanaerobaculia bacterium]